MSKIPFAYIHMHTRYSQQDSQADVKDYVRAINAYNKEENKYEIVGLSISEHGNMHSIVKQYQACKDTTINPIYGCELYHAIDRNVSTDGRFHLCVFAKDQEGLTNLYRLVSDAGINRIVGKTKIFTMSDEAQFKKYGKGLIATSACLGGIIPKFLLGDDRLGLAPDYEKAKETALKYQELFDEFYLEVQPHEFDLQLELNKQIVQLAKDTGIPLVMGIDAHYVYKRDKKFHDILKIMAYQKPYESENYMYTPEEVEAYCLKHDIPLEAMSNTVKISEACHVDPKPKDSRGLLPEYPVPQGYTENSYLIELANIGLMEKISSKEITDIPTYIERLNYEIDVITTAGFSGYFLILWDWFLWCRKNDIAMGKGRGYLSSHLMK